MIVIISDTHDNTEATETAVTMIRELAPELVVHCGDITSVGTLMLFAGLPLYFVFGNCDSEHELLAARATELGWNKFGRELIFKNYDKKFYVYHGDNREHLERQIDLGEFDYVLTGHTHQITDAYIGSTRVINPGAFERVKHYSFATLKVETDQLEFVTVPF